MASCENSQISVRLALIAVQVAVAIGVFMHGYGKLAGIDFDQLPWYWSNLVAVCLLVFMIGGLALPLVDPDPVPLTVCLAVAGIWILPIAMTWLSVTPMAMNSGMSVYFQDHRFYPSYGLVGTLAVGGLILVTRGAWASKQLPKPQLP
jgi:hypothetical protein